MRASENPPSTSFGGLPLIRRSGRLRRVASIAPTLQCQAQTSAQTELVEGLHEQIGYLRGVIATREQERAVRAAEIRRWDRALEREQQLAAFSN
jgi:hypothetical protein